MDSESVDLTEFRQTMRDAGVEEEVITMLNVYLEDAPQRIEDIEKAMGDADADQIEKTAHVFKSASGTIGAKRLAELLSTIEQLGASGNAEEATGMQGELQNEYHRVIEYLDKYVEQESGRDI
jgi:HPt (histidine-containing phosphotransfer) domain-containing protein